MYRFVSMLAITMSCAEMDKPIKMSCGDVDLGGPRNHVVDGDPDPQGNGQFFCRGAPCDSDHLFYTPHRRLKTSHRMCCRGGDYRGDTSPPTFWLWGDVNVPPPLIAHLVILLTFV